MTNLTKREQTKPEYVLGWVARRWCVLKASKSFDFDGVHYEIEYEGDDRRKMERLVELLTRGEALNTSSRDEPDARIAELEAEVETLRDFKNAWDERDGNPPGYNLEKARSYGEMTARLSKRVAELERERDRYKAALKSVVVIEPEGLSETQQWDHANEVKDVARQALKGADDE